MKKPELLAPVGSWEAFVAALENGADAIYLGGRGFNARQYAQNLGSEELAKAVEMAHLRGVKVLITVNTLVNNEEFADLVSYLHELYQLGVDGVIVQDLGVAHLVREAFPALPLHGSTQMTVHNLEGAKLLERLGFSRVIPARELTLEDIRELVEGTTMEVEVFIHGALCVCYSGQCLMSSLIGGRSGNRGRCAQPCRLEYTLVRQNGTGGQAVQEGHLLSTRDLQLIDHVPELCRAGVASFKIEGRMKRPEYVATVVRVYREALDRYEADPENYSVTAEEKQDLAQVFSRGFTTGYLVGEPQPALVNYQRPNHRGIPVGRVEGQGKKGVLVKLTAPLAVGDELQFWVSQGGRIPWTVQELWVENQAVEQAKPGDRVRIPVAGPIRPGDRIFKMKAAKLEERARASYQNAGVMRPIPVNLVFTARAGEPCHLVLADDQGNQGQGVTDFIVQGALHRPLTRDKVENQLLRLGNTLFQPRDVEINLVGQVMVPFSELNELRRRAVEDLEAKRLADYGYPHLKIDEAKGSFQRILPKPRTPGRQQPKLAITVNSRAKLEAALAAGVEIIYFGGEVFGPGEMVFKDDLVWAKNRCHSQGVELYAATPRLVRRGEIPRVKEFLAEAAQVGVDGILAGNLGVFHLAQSLPVPVAVDYYLNIFNSLAIDLVKQLGALRVTLSPELTFRQVEDLTARTTMEVECVVAGQLPLMVMDHYFPQAVWHQEGAAQGYHLKDRKGVLFPIAIDGERRMHLFNAMELAMVTDVPRLARAGVGILRIEARNRDESYVEETGRLYRKAMKAVTTGVFDPEEATRTVQKLNPDGVTKGHFYRGVE